MQGSRRDRRPANRKRPNTDDRRFETADTSQAEPDALLHIKYPRRFTRAKRTLGEIQVSSIVYLVGLVVIVMAILSFVGLG
jgi:hypothetical protein